MQMIGNTILITGGTSGLGRGLAEAFHKLGNQVAIAGRRQGRLDEITAANPGMLGFQLDVQDSAAIDAFAARVRQELPELNVLINSAGISRPESLTADPVDLSVSRDIIETNIVSVLDMTAALLPALKTKPGATIITTTSGLAFVPRNNFPTHCASKAFLHSWLQSLRVQLRGAVEVLEMAPPYVQTELSGPCQSTDPYAMPLAAYIDEVMQLLADPNPPGREILVKRVMGERWAERDGDYARRFAIFNGA